MQTEIIIAGFGGQGVLFAGQVLAYAAMDSGKTVTWIPSYGPEMRGGTANCTVVISDDEIGSPLVLHPRASIVLNLPSLDKYEPLVAPGGVLVANASLINRGPSRSDIHNIFIPVNDIAEGLGDKRLINMVALGALLGRLPVLPVEAIQQALSDHLPERHKRLLPVNFQALRLGSDFAHKEGAIPV
ncbi:MAG: 2-oxoacid:acceptor oxidoreductase family protein [Chloroflexi bacterium]|nr:2-oxoacid:acceptor oxidoreductase family protein [Chloroflexota bacterium]